MKVIQMYLELEEYPKEQIWVDFHAFSWEERYPEMGPFLSCLAEPLLQL